MSKFQKEAFESSAKKDTNYSIAEFFKTIVTERREFSSCVDSVYADETNITNSESGQVADTAR